MEGLSRIAGRVSVGTITSVWRWRRLARELAIREFRARYAGSALGAAWAVVEPAVQFGLYLTVFSVFLGMRLEGKASVGWFGLYLVAGLVPFLALQESLQRAASLARGQAGLVRHVNVPLEVLLAGTLGAVLARHAVALLLVVLVAAGSGALTLAQIPWLAAGAAALVAVVWGLGLVLMTAGAFLPDVAQVVGTGTTVLFFLTPVVYPESALPAAVVKWLPLNPAVGRVDLFRAGIGGGPVSALRTSVTAATALAALAAGAFVFARRGSSVRDLV
jgi:lipopolysaccharide transport system permease protein